MNNMDADALPAPRNAALSLENIEKPFFLQDRRAQTLTSKLLNGARSGIEDLLRNVKADGHPAASEIRAGKLKGVQAVPIRATHPTLS
jgi:hypothetical protein